MLQQGSPVSGVESSYNEDLTNLIAYVKERSDAKLVWHMTWAYQQDSTHEAFPNYGSDQMTMYNAIVAAVNSVILPKSDFKKVIPNGTAVCRTFFMQKNNLNKINPRSKNLLRGTFTLI